MVINCLLQDNDPATYEKFLSRKIPDHLKNELEGLLTQAYLEEALQKVMEPNSAPGVDGFTVKFLRVFWPSFAGLITKGVIQMKTKGKLTITLRTDIMKLLQKGEKDLTDPKNFCPISLLSVIYKIAIWAISKKINTTLGYII